MWKKFPTNSPPKEGWYQCTVEIKNQQRYVMNLYWRYNKDSVYGGRWKDNIRQDVFNTYEIYDRYGKQLHTSDECDRTYSVVAWKKMPKPYTIGFGYRTPLQRAYSKGD